MKKVFAVSIISIMFFSLAGSVLSQNTGQPLEIEYPEVEREKPDTTATELPKYVKYIFNFFSAKIYVKISILLIENVKS